MFYAVTMHMKIKSHSLYQPGRKGGLVVGGVEAGFGGDGTVVFKHKQHSKKSCPSYLTEQSLNISGCYSTDRFSVLTFNLVDTD